MDIVKKRFSFYEILIVSGFMLMAVTDLNYWLLPSAFGYTDEIFTLLCLCCFVLYYLRKSSSAQRIEPYLLLLPCIVVIGLIGNMFSGLRISKLTAVEDAFLFCKAFIIFAFMDTCVSKKQALRMYRGMVRFAKLFLLAVALIAIVSMFVDLNMERNGNEFKLYATHPGAVASWCILCFALIASRSGNHRLLYLLPTVFIVLRTKSGLGFVGLIGLVLAYLFIEKQKKLRLWYFLIITPAVAIAGRNEIAEYILDATSPRAMIIRNGFKVAKMFFPLGSGFATYCSPLSVKNTYSPLYYILGFSKKWGMSPTYSVFLQDGYYPMIIAQLGFFGALLWAVMIVLILRKIIVSIRHKKTYTAAMFTIGFWLLSGTGFSLTGPWGCAAFVVLAVFMRCTDPTGLYRLVIVSDDVLDDEEQIAENNPG